MAKTSVEIDIQVQSKSLQDLEQELKDVNEQLAKVPIGGDDFKRLSKEAQGLTQELDKANAAAEGFTSEDKFMAAEGSIKLLGGSLAGVVGTLGVLGVESEVFGEFEQKAASAIAVLVGFRDVAEGIRQLGPAFKKAGVAAKLFGNTTRTAIAATGIGLLIVGLGTVIAYWDDITEAISGASREQKDLLDSQEQAVALSQQAYDTTLASENILKLQGKTEKEIRDLKIQQLNTTIADLQAQLTSQQEIKKAQVETAERNKTIAQNIIRLVTLPITTALKGIDLLTKKLAELGLLDESYVTNLEESFSGGIAGFIFNPENVAKEADAGIEETEKKLLELKNTVAGFQLQARNEEQAAEEARQAEADAKAEERRNDQLEKEKELAALKQEIRNAEANTEAELRAKELQDVDQYYQDLILKAQEAGLSTEELERSRLERLKELRDGYAEEDLSRAQEAYDKEIELEKLKIQGKQQAVEAVAELAGRESGIGRALLAFKQALALKETLLDIKRITFKGTQAVAEAGVDAASNVSSSSKIGFPQNLITIAAAIGQGIALIGSVKSAVGKTKAAGAGTQAPPPSFAGAQPQAPIQPLPEITTRAPQTFDASPAQRAYVLAGDVTSNQEADAKLNTKRTII